MMRVKKQFDFLNMRAWSIVLGIVAAIMMLPCNRLETSAEEELKNPRIEENSSMEAGQKVTWDCIWFGSYPQAEVIPSDMEYTALDDTLYQDGDIIVSDDTYNTLRSAEDWDENNEMILNGTKYRRMQEKDAVNHQSSYYRWSDNADYHYFQYRPIKWRVLHTDGKQALLLSDIVLDDQLYNLADEDVTWETSTMRSWLNGYSAENNRQSADYGQKNFINSAFSPLEQEEIIDSEIENADSITYGSGGGNNTTDKIFLLSESEVWNTDKAMSYGFAKSNRTYDEARRCMSSVFAKAMGVSGNDVTAYWWLRSPGRNGNCALHVYSDGYIGSYGKEVQGINDGVRVALNLSLSSANNYAYAGTVCSDGTVDEIPKEMLTEEEASFLKQHLEFIQSDTYANRMDSRWSIELNKGLDTSGKKAAETIYNILKSVDEFSQCKALSVFDNPYEAIITELVMSQTQSQQQKFEVEFRTEEAKQVDTLVSILQTLCKMSDGTWEWKSEYKTSVEKLIEKPSDVKTDNPTFYNMCNELFGKYFKDEDNLNKFLGNYGKVSDFFKALDTYENVIEWVVDCANYYSAVEAYLDTSKEFKSSLVEIAYFMEDNWYKAQYSAALNKYIAFLDKNLTEEDVARMMSEEFIGGGMERIADVFGGSVSQGVLVWLTEELGMSETSTAWVFAAVKAYNTGMTLSESITKNGDKMDCRETLRAIYYLSKAAREAVEGRAEKLKENQTYASASMFDACYSILQDLEISTLSTYEQLLTYDEESISGFLRWISGQNHNLEEYDFAEYEKIRWTLSDCHYEEGLIISGEAQFPTYKDYTVISVACPTDVYIYDSENKLVLGIENNEIINRSRKVSAFVKGDEKKIGLADREKYTVKIVATGDGMMNYEETLIATTGKLMQTVRYPEVILKAENEYQAVANSGKKGQIILTEKEDSGSDKVISSSETITYEETSAPPQISPQIPTKTPITDKKKVKTISVAGISKKIAAGKKITLKATISPEDADNKAIKWSSGNTKIATVTQKGVVTIKKNSGGKSVTITATASDGSGVKGTYKITCMKGVVKKISISGNKSVKAGKTLKLKAKVTATKKANTKLKWSSSNTKYAKVSSSGKVKTYKTGKGKKVKITAMATDGSGKKKSVTVKIK